MKIICIGRNYREHINELKNAVPTKPVIFIKHKNALLTKRQFLYPEFTAQLHYEAELVFRVSKNGKYISKRKALDYVDAITVGLDLTARDVQEELKAKGPFCCCGAMGTIRPAYGFK
jgi:2-keto-4-pentenoate hydratase/2-oxohepta-3-ene-1,7-dioic acid hydratase in catechol pathway